jgi:cobalamin-dependent methionine synthase I
MAETADDKVKLAGLLVEKLTAAGVPLEDIYIDPLVYPLSTNPQSAGATLDAIGGIMKRFPGVHTVCGLTNVSYGLPARKLINRTFLAAAITMGLDAAIIDPTDKQLYAMLKAVTLVVGRTCRIEKWFKNVGAREANGRYGEAYTEALIANDILHRLSRRRSGLMAPLMTLRVQQSFART